jgi:hypothetical protein
MTGRARERRRREVTGKIGEGTVGGGPVGAIDAWASPRRKKSGPGPKAI